MNHIKQEEASTAVIHRMLCVMRSHRRQIEQAAARFGIHRSQHVMLMKISEMDPPPSQKQIADFLEITPAAAALCLGKLEKDGYIRRRTGKEDGRTKYIELTEKGSEIITLSHRAFGEIDRYCFSDFSEQELEQLNEFLSRIRNNLQNVAKESTPQ